VGIDNDIKSIKNSILNYNLIYNRLVDEESKYIFRERLFFLFQGMLDLFKMSLKLPKKESCFIV